MTNLELLTIGCELNRTTSRVMVSTFADMLHATMYSAQTMIDDKTEVSKEPFQLFVPSLAGAMWKLKSITAVSKRQVTRYAVIALAFLQNEFSSNDLKEIIKECQALGVSHIGNSPLLSLDRIGMILGIESVAAYLKKPREQSKKGKGKKRGAFHEIRTHFYECFSELYKCVREEAVARSMEVTTLLGKQLQLSRGQHRSARETVRMQMSIYKGHERRIARDKDQAARKKVLLRAFKNS